MSSNFRIISFVLFFLKVFAADTAEVLTYHQTTVPLIYPHEGWVEQDPVEIITAVRECLNQTVINLEQLRIDPADIVAIGVTNQRETTVVWDHVTGEPLNNAIGNLNIQINPKLININHL